MANELQSRQWYARQMASGHWDIADEVTGKTIARTDTEANARLIEAAPNMLKALRATFDVLTVSGKHSYRPDSETGRAIEAVRDAIAQAEGRAT